MWSLLGQPISDYNNLIPFYIEQANLTETT